MVMSVGNHFSPIERKQTVVTAQETWCFVWNMATNIIRQAINLPSVASPQKVDEFQYAGITPEPYISAPGPRLLESSTHFERHPSLEW